MVYWGLKVISAEYILIAAFFVTAVVPVCTGTSWGSAGTVGVALMGVAAGLDVSLAAAAVLLFLAHILATRSPPSFRLNELCSCRFRHHALRTHSAHVLHNVTLAL